MNRFSTEHPESLLGRALRSAGAAFAGGSPSSAAAPLLAGVLSLLVFAPAAAQQYVVDDAEIVDRGACQVEAWHGERNSWILPACQPIRNLEITAGVGFIDLGDGRREVEHAVEAKTLLRSLADHDWGVGLVLGVGPNPSAAPGERRFGDVYAFVPASFALADGRLVLHANLGWEWERDGHEHDGVIHDEDSHHLTWGLRADLPLTERFAAIGEFSGEDRLRPEYQVGIRTHVPDAGVEVDVSWGGHTDDLSGAGLTVGIALVSGRIF